MELYIKGIGSISPSENFENISHTPEIKLVDDVYKYYFCIEPIYKEIINPLLLRRMSRAMKMGIASALLCLKDAKIETPDAIITATGLGCVDDSDKFLTSLIENEEKMLNPTPFIQSTHNTISSQIALILKCHGYNSTYAGRGACFETALLDAKILINEEHLQNVLVGAYDELIANQIRILYRLGLFRHNNNLSIHTELDSASQNLPGEGASFFVVSPTSSDTVYAKISDFEIVNNTMQVKNVIANILIKNSISFENVNSVMVGSNSSFDKHYTKFIDLFPYSNILWFKHLCGEYMTSSAFALLLAAHCLKNKYIPEIAYVKKTNNKNENILIINRLLNGQTALFLLNK
ncbi:MAG: hypothetical protein COS14_04520 [Bacteroidetes bacterium CG02_land_8_20_14_3_00_31_25]|nr:beta-ketoacyl synthase chain length factor [Bacteroidota bacterium]PIV60891.1 MAG: hypothetical protein COS14_04520 [Bacteroidetes bacterium CG02_land_8_20_14_3_00_31_25]